MADVQRTKPKPGFRLDLTHSLSRGLVGWWLFNEGGGSILYDQSINSNDGTIKNINLETGWVGSPRGGAIDFGNASNDASIDVGSNASLDDVFPLTYAAWIYIRSTGESDRGGIVDKNALAQPMFAMNFGGSVRRLKFSQDFDTSDLSAISDGNELPLNTWIHVAVTWDGSTDFDNVFFFVNGASVPVSASLSSDASGSRVSDASRSLIIGNGAFDGADFDGLIDDLRIYNRVLNATEIQQLYSNPYANVLRQNTTKRRLFHALWLAKQRDRLFSKVNGGLAR